MPTTKDFKEKDGRKFFAFISDKVLFKSLFYLGDEKLSEGIMFLDMYDSHTDKVIKKCQVRLSHITHVDPPKAAEGEEQLKPIKLNSKGVLLGEEPETRYWFARPIENSMGEYPLIKKLPVIGSFFYTIFSYLFFAYTLQ